jgi:hypothetical protein
MAVRIQTSAPKTLLKKVRAAVRAGEITTWEIDDDNDLTLHVAAWNGRAWFRGTAVDGLLVFNIVAPRGAAISSKLYAVFHGRLTEMLLSEFDSDFDSLEVGALLDEGDLVGR